MTQSPLACAQSPLAGAGLPGNPPSAVDAARDKHAARAAMQVGKLPTPRHALIHEAKDLQAAGDHVQFPAGKLGACSPAVCCSLCSTLWVFSRAWSLPPGGDHVQVSCSEWAAQCSSCL